MIKSRKHSSPTRSAASLATASLVTGLSLAMLPVAAQAESASDTPRTLDQVQGQAARGFKVDKVA